MSAAPEPEAWQPSRVTDLLDLGPRILPAVRSPWDFVDREPGWSMAAWQAEAVREVLEAIQSKLDHRNGRPYASALGGRTLAAVADEPTGESLHIGDLHIDADTRMVTIVGRSPVRLSKTELRLLVHLARHADALVRSDELLAAVWGDRAGLPVVANYIRYLRKRGVVIESRSGPGGGYLLPSRQTVPDGSSYAPEH